MSTPAADAGTWHPDPSFGRARRGRRRKRRPWHSDAQRDSERFLPRAPYKLYGKPSVVVKGNDEIKTLLDSARARGRVPGRRARLPVSSYMWNQGMVYALRTSCASSSTISSATASSPTPRLKSVLDTIDAAVAELPLTAKLAKALLDEFSSACKAWWGPRRCLAARRSDIVSANSVSSSSKIRHARYPYLCFTLHPSPPPFAPRSPPPPPPSIVVVVVPAVGSPRIPVPAPRIPPLQCAAWGCCRRICAGISPRTAQTPPLLPSRAGGEIAQVAPLIPIPDFGEGHTPPPFRCSLAPPNTPQLRFASIHSEIPRYTEIHGAGIYLRDGGRSAEAESARQLRGPRAGLALPYSASGLEAHRRVAEGVCRGIGEGARGRTGCMQVSARVSEGKIRLQVSYGE
ncbi:hypothetical protein C8F04DRAFT_1349695 [Mycena alexandri]|uniref:Uncharacterized protein n=1 Tax=Mycena alexandri TaxID=1745969 RepID=A0AAD6SUK7_9AGAR|nr:hypothetical protein C8F04DRAFT_1349695 [Mycena alexandri]